MVTSTIGLFFIVKTLLLNVLKNNQKYIYMRTLFSIVNIVVSNVLLPFLILLISSSFSKSLRKKIPLFNKIDGRRHYIVYLLIGCIIFKVGYEICDNLEKKELENRIESYIQEKRINSISRGVKVPEKDLLAYQNVVWQILNEAEPDATVKINNKFKGIDSQKEINVDLSIHKIEVSKEIITIVKTIFMNNPVPIDSLRSFQDILVDLRATKGVIFSNSGYTDEAKQLAPEYGIELLSIYDTRFDFIKVSPNIPVLKIEIILNISIALKFSTIKEDKILKDPLKWIISLDGGKTRTDIVTIFTKLWNSNKISKQIIKSEKINLDLSNAYFMSNSNNWIKIIQWDYFYDFKRVGFLKYFKPNEFRAIENHLTGDIVPLYIEMDIVPIENKNDWIKVVDIEGFKKRSKGITVIITLDFKRPDFTNIKTDSFNMKKIK